ncbi:12946_t:CDS:2 [Entrophospora sp. SA101]|nr:12946_t:CDS:2 [Entrophospora sp. SA101]
MSLSSTPSLTFGYFITIGILLNEAESLKVDGFVTVEVVIAISGAVDVVIIECKLFF